MKKANKKFLKLAQSLLAILVLALILFIPLYPKFPSLKIPRTYVRIRAEDFLVALTYLVALPVAWKKRKKLFDQKIIQAISTYWLVGLIATISGIFITKLVWPHIALLHYLRRIEYMGLFIIGFLATRDKNDTKIFIIATIIALLGVVSFGLGQKFFDLPVISTMNEEFSKGTLLNLNVWTRISATFGGHYDLAAYLAFLLPLLLTVFFIKKTKRWLVIPIFGLGYYLLILTASRISFAAYLGSTFLLLLFLGRKWWLIPVVGLSLAGSFFSTDINQRFAATIKYDLPRLTTKISQQVDQLFPERAKRRLAQITPTTTPAATPTPAQSQKPTPTTNPTAPSGAGITATPTVTLTPTPTPPPTQQENTELGVERSGGIRFDVEWPRALRHFKSSPVIGTGYSSLGLATDNDYLRALGETGLLGLITFLNIFCRVGIFLWQKHMENLSQPQRFLLIGIGCATLSLLANALFIDAFEASKVAFIFWLTLGIIVKNTTLDYVQED